MFEKLTNQSKEALDSAASLALHANNQEITSAHLLWAMLTDTQSILNQALSAMNADIAAITLEAKSAVENLPKSSQVSKESLRLSQELANALHSAQGYATQNGDSYIALDSIIIANSKSEIFVKILGKYVDMHELAKSLESMRAGAKISSQNDDSTLQALAKFGSNASPQKP